MGVAMGSFGGRVKERPGEADAVEFEVEEGTQGKDGFFAFTCHGKTALEGF